MIQTISLKEYLALCEDSGITKKSDLRKKHINGLESFDVLSMYGADDKRISNERKATRIFKDFVNFMYPKYPESKFIEAGITIKTGEKEDQNAKSFLINGTKDKWVLADFKVDDLMFRCATFVKVAEPDMLDKYTLTIDVDKHIEKPIEESLGNPESSEWYPSLTEYDPGISKEQWVDILNDPSIVGPVWGRMLAMFYRFPDGATCSMIADTFADNAASVNATAMNFARKIYEVTGCPVMEEDGVKRYWRIPFIGRGTVEGEIGTWMYKLRPELYDALEDVNILRYLNNSETEDNAMTPKDLLTHITKYIKAKGYHYSDQVITNFYLSLRAKPFVILAGVSGTGKSKIAKLFAEAIGADFNMIPVRPDWSDSSDLLGYVDLQGKFRSGKLTEALLKANENTDKPYFICLDEMNLARVEYYFSDMLSLMESSEEEYIFSESYFSEDTGDVEKYGSVHLSDNVYIIGTVNMDETTYPFSRKVLDRANTIEFNEIDFSAGLGDIPKTPDPIKVDNSLLKRKYGSFKDAYDDAKDEIDTMIEVLEKVNVALEGIGAQVAYRVRDEIAAYLATGAVYDLGDFAELMDNCMMQKILPRIQGSSGAVDEALEKMKMITDEKNYKRSGKKLEFMIKRKNNDGYTSYWL